MSIVEPAVPATSEHREVGRTAIDCALAGLERLRDGLDERFDAAATVLGACTGKVITLGVGKSGHAAEKAAGTLRSVGLPALCLNPSDSLHGDLGVVARGDVALLFSKSGTTRELLAMLPHLRAQAVTLIAVVGAPRSPLGRECDIELEASVEREGCPLDSAPMASVIAAQALADALVAAAMRARGFTTGDFARLHPAGALGARLTLTVNDVMRRGDELPVVGDGASLKQAVIEITRAGYGAVCVVSPDGRLTGFLTDGDVRRGLLETDDLAGVPASAFMSVNPLTISPELPLSQALMLLEQRKKAFLTAPVVVDGGRCVGLLRLHDAVQAHLPR